MAWKLRIAVLTGLLGALIASTAPSAVIGSETKSSAPLAQRFLGGDASIVVSGAGVACVAGAVIDIEASRYREADGTFAAFDAVARSRAASLQFIAPVGGGSEVARIQLKFAVGQGPVLLQVGDGFVRDIRPWLEASGDSFRIDAPAVLAALRNAAEGGPAATVTTVSRDTGRTVVDTLPTMSFAAYEACSVGAADMPAGAVGSPSALAQVVFEAEPTDASRATPAESRVCGVTEPDVRLHRGVLRAISGFTAPTDRIFVEFDARGEVRRLHIPGLLDANRDGHDYAARLSVSASSNDPMAANSVTGCLGLAPVPLCDLAGEPPLSMFPGGAPEGVRSVGYCIGALAMGGLLDDAVFLSDFVADNPSSVVSRRASFAAATGVGGPSSPFPTGGGGGVGASGGFGGGGSGGGGFNPPLGPPSSSPPETAPETPPETPLEPPMVIPLPPSLWLALSGLVALAAVTRRPRAPGSGLSGAGGDA
ncbi:hypothetical protein [Rubrimonas cliftonensis]|uniref:VPLPA-CTERM protein sorting domain-containing protein n=1 Tax=Rubrimonas cliftonensis TaxID=89524 RepID=A0A1H3W851_9RHOB|nr:hypothetical protein [Rubrimonas cliftonensis]SDZ82604.1 hypothetical protein SAMN05444370_101541 [Rubrimonas cliftonensis]